MKIVFKQSRMILTFVSCIVIVISHLAVARDTQQKRTDNSINRARRQHYEIYKRYDEAVNSPNFNPMVLFKELHTPIAEWCAKTAPLYDRWSMHAGDKAKTLTNERVKQQWIEVSACYNNMAKICRSVVANFKADKCAKVMADVKLYVTAEQGARQKRFVCVPRTWLTSDEALQLRWQEDTSQNKSKSNKNSSAEANGTTVADDDEPRQGRVRNTRRTSQNQNVTGGQRQRRGTRSQYNRQRRH